MNPENPTPDPHEEYVDGQFLVQEYSRYRRLGALVVLLALALLIAATVFAALTQPQSIPPTPEVTLPGALFWLQ